MSDHHRSLDRALARLDQPREVVIDERPPCSRCGEPMTAGVALLNLGSSCEPLELPAARDDEAIERAIAAGVIDR